MIHDRLRRWPASRHERRLAARAGAAALVALRPRRGGGILSGAVGTAGHGEMLVIGTGDIRTAAVPTAVRHRPFHDTEAPPVDRGTTAGAFSTQHLFLVVSTPLPKENYLRGPSDANPAVLPTPAESPPNPAKGCTCMLNETYRNALSDAKSAVRAYANEPSERNAERVEVAWQTVKRLRAAANWQRPSQDQ